MTVCRQIMNTPTSFVQNIVLKSVVMKTLLGGEGLRLCMCDKCNRINVDNQFV